MGGGVLRFFISTLLFLLNVFRLSEASKAIGSIGGVVDCSSRVGREEKIAMELAVHDFHTLTAYKLALHLHDLSAESARAAFAAINLVKNQQVEAIVGLTWQEASLVAEMNDITNELPIISLTSAAISPAVPAKRRSVIRMGHDIATHMNCIAAIVGSFKWQKVIAIYEDRNPYMGDLGMISLLTISLRDVGAELEHYLDFPALSSLEDPKTTVQEELKKLKGKQSRVFILLQSSLTLTALLFEQANQLGMMEKDNVWITADGITSLLDSVNSSVMASMQGVVGFKTYFPDTTTSFKEFEVRFRRKFRSDYPEEDKNADPSVFALRAYDAIWAIAKAAEKLQERSDSRTLLQYILSSDFQGLSDKIHFVNYELDVLPTFQIVNVVGKSYKELAFWTPKLGFTENIGPVFWPGGKTSAPTGLMETSLSYTGEKRLRIGVLARSSFVQFVKVVSPDESQNVTRITGFSIDVFEAAVRYLRYPLIYEMVPFYGSSDDMVKEVSNKTFDAAIGDIIITADRFEHIEFSQPYVESGLVMVVRMKPDKSNEPFMIMRPFTKSMWFMMAAMTLATGFVVWLLEHRTNHEFRGSPARQLGTVFWFSFSTLFFSHRESLRSSLSRLILIPWLFLILIVTSTYTANLTTILTTSRLEPSAIEVGLLRRTNAAVGCDGNSFTIRYLAKVLGFKPENIKSIASIDEYATALSSGQIRAAFMLTPHARVFLAQYCNGFSMAGPTYKLGGYGFVFPKGSELALDISEAIIRITESGELQQLEEMLSFSSCTSRSDTAVIQSLGPGPFSGLFMVSGGASAVALLITVFRLLRKHWQRVTLYIQAALMGRGFWKWMATLFTQNQKSDEHPLCYGNPVMQTQMVMQRS